ncbi:MAG TPA: FkbM family methyltransferase [Bryobacteraceae bacterium]|nr:FkbM family methyltransferase [Bryobacteraceae bacterium]
MGGLTPRSARKFIPHRWTIEPFTLYGNGWSCKYQAGARDAIGHHIFLRGLRNWEAETVPVFRELVKTSRCFLDVGANFGIYTLVGCFTNANLQVIAMEPVPAISAVLRENVRCNHLEGRVTVMQAAASKEEGSVPFHESDEPTMGSLNVKGYRGFSGKLIQVRTLRLDSLNVKPDLIKIDVEGFEDVVLEGAEELLATGRPRIIPEANPDGPYERVTEILRRHGYGFQHLTPSGPRAAEVIQPNAGEHFCNWLCLPQS